MARKATAGWRTGDRQDRDRGRASWVRASLLATAGLAGALGLVGTAASASAAPPATTPRTYLSSFSTQPAGQVTGVAVDPTTGDVYATDFDHRTVEKFTAAGTIVTQVAATLNGPLALARDSAGNLYVGDDAGTVAKYTSAGGLVWQLHCCSLRVEGVAVDPSSGDVYVSDYDGNVVRRLAPADGRQLATITTGKGPAGAAVDGSGDLYVASRVDNVVQEFAPDGSLLGMFGQRGASPGQFSGPVGLATDTSSGDVYVTDFSNQRVERFTSGGVFLSQFYTGQDPAAVAVDPATGVVYVGLLAGTAVQLFGIAPAISGSPVNGATVYASRPSQVGRGPFTYTYQWLDCPPGGGACANDGAATSSNGLRLKPSDVRQTIEVAVTETSPAGTVGPVTSAAFGPVQASPPINTAAPTISGSTLDGSVLSATHGTWTGLPATSYTYQWQSCAAGSSCANVGTNQAGYRLQPTDVGHTIKVLVSATNPDGATGPVASSPVGPVTPSPPVNTAPPTITGTYATASRLTGHAGSWSGVPPITYAYQWQRCPDATPTSCTDIPGATLNNYRLTATDTHVRLVVQAANADGGPVTAYSTIAP